MGLDNFHEHFQDHLFEGWHEVFLAFRVQMARKGLCVTRHGWFTQSVETDMVEMVQNG